jgi:hypothetical protein
VLGTMASQATMPSTATVAGGTTNLWMGFG